MPSKSPIIDLDIRLEKSRYGETRRYRGHQVKLYYANVTILVKDGTITGDYDPLEKAGGVDYMLEMAREKYVKEDSNYGEEADGDEVAPVDWGAVHTRFQNCSIKDSVLEWNIGPDWTPSMGDVIFEKGTVMENVEIRAYSIYLDFDRDRQLGKWPYTGCRVWDTSEDSRVPLLAWNNQGWNHLSAHGLIVKLPLGY